MHVCRQVSEIIFVGFARLWLRRMLSKEMVNAMGQYFACKVTFFKTFKIVCVNLTLCTFSQNDPEKNAFYMVCTLYMQFPEP